MGEPVKRASMPRFLRTSSWRNLRSRWRRARKRKRGSGSDGGRTLKGRKKGSGRGGIGRGEKVVEEVGRGLEGGAVDIELKRNVASHLVRSVDSGTAFTVGMDDLVFKIPAS